MSRKLTTYNRPSIATLLATAPTFEQLARYWHDLGRAGRAGNIDADDKTVNRWLEACWVRVGYFIVRAPTANAAAYVYNSVRRWKKPPGVEEQLRDLFERTVAAMPDEVEQLARRGITIEDVSTPEQCAKAEAVRRAASP